MYTSFGQFPTKFNNNTIQNQKPESNISQIASLILEQQQSILAKRQLSQIIQNYQGPEATKQLQVAPFNGLRLAQQSPQHQQFPQQANQSNSNLLTKLLANLNSNKSNGINSSIPQPQPSVNPIVLSLLQSIQKNKASSPSNPNNLSPMSNDPPTSAHSIDQTQIITNPQLPTNFPSTQKPFMRTQYQGEQSTSQGYSNQMMYQTQQNTFQTSDNGNNSCPQNKSIKKAQKKALAKTKLQDPEQDVDSSNKRSSPNSGKKKLTKISGYQLREEDPSDPDTEHEEETKGEDYQPSEPSNIKKIREKYGVRTGPKRSIAPKISQTDADRNKSFDELIAELKELMGYENIDKPKVHMLFRKSDFDKRRFYIKLRRNFTYYKNRLRLD